MKKTSFTKLMSGLLTEKDPPNMWRPGEGLYPRLAEVGSAAEVAGREGLYALWHLGVRPQWLRVGAAKDLGRAFEELAQAPWVVTHQRNAGIHAAWAFVPPGQHAGMVRFLTETLNPAFQGEGEGAAHDSVLDPSAPPIACVLPPGTQP